MENETQKKTYERITGELSRFLPIGYLIMVIIGMIFNYFRFEMFGLNIFQYASVFDFLISPFEDMHILLFIVGSMLLVIFTMKMDRLWKKHFPKSYKKWTFKWTERACTNPPATSLSLLPIYFTEPIFTAYTPTMPFHKNKTSPSAIRTTRR